MPDPSMSCLSSYKRKRRHSNLFLLLQPSSSKSLPTCSIDQWSRAEADTNYGGQPIENTTEKTNIAATSKRTSQSTPKQNRHPSCCLCQATAAPQARLVDCCFKLSSFPPSPDSQNASPSSWSLLWQSLWGIQPSSLAGSFAKSSTQAPQNHHRRESSRQALQHHRPKPRKIFIASPPRSSLRGIQPSSLATSSSGAL